MMHDMQRITGLIHVQPRERPPRAADGIEIAASAIAQGGTSPSSSRAILPALASDSRQVVQGEAAERQCRSALAACDAVTSVEFERAAAEVADDAVRLDGCLKRCRARRVRPRAGPTGWSIGTPMDSRRCGDEVPRRCWHRGGRGGDGECAATRIAPHRARNRANASAPLSTASSGSMPVDRTPRPRPAITFSLKIGVGAGRALHRRQAEPNSSRYR